MTTIRRDKDFYITPSWAVNILLDNYQIHTGHVLEPCAGNGAVCKALREHDSWDGSITAVEIREEEQDALSKVCDDVIISDFLQVSKGDLKLPEHGCLGAIISNPPFSIAQEIIEHCFEISDEDTEIIMLLRLGWLESKKRRPFWVNHPNVSLITLMERPKFIGKSTDFAAYGWFIWNKQEQFILPCVAGRI